MNFKLTLQYDGTDFHGWQMQSEGRTVQGELVRVLSMIEGRAVAVHGSGRTDAGVHAEGQVASCRLEREFEPEKWRVAINGNLERDVRVIKVEAVEDDFHARYSARGKTYVYRTFNEPVTSPFWHRYALAEARTLDLTLMQEAARLFIGEHDWTAFAVQAEAESLVRRVTELEVVSRWDERGQGRLIEIRASANGFLRYMVRSIAGCLLAVGRGEMSLEEVERAIRSGRRSSAYSTAPAHGLTLLRVHYD
ncbi:MAG TPA: tRNA pseudouridine(38-40) synthase TruA [Pyrinomonadaceae bacterium]|nr:tRNA pseudouridine(38-40) synthase TruA [Pyrinomonadaceae bacterium]